MVNVEDLQWFTPETMVNLGHFTNIWDHTVGVLRRLGLAGADDGAEGDEVRLQGLR
jgi:hypothetical protein